MEQVTLTFDRVFDLHRLANKGPCTLFSFDSGGKSHYAVSVQGHPPIVAGMTVTALLRAPGNWQTLIGWIDHRSGKVWAHSPVEPFARACVALAFSMCMLAIARVEAPGSFHLGWSLLALAFGVGVLTLFRQGLQRIREQRAFKTVLVELEGARVT